MKRYSLDKNAPGMFEHATGGWVKVKDVREMIERAVKASVDSETPRAGMDLIVRELSNGLKNHHETSHRSLPST